MGRIAVIGLGYFGREVAHALVARGHDVIAIDKDLACVEELSDTVEECIRLDATSRDALEAHRVHEADACVVCMGDAFEEAELTTVALASLGVERIIARGTTRERVRILEALGPEVVSPDVTAARRLADELTLDDFTTVHEITPGLYSSTLVVGEDMDGVALSELRVGKHQRVTALLREGLDYDDSPRDAFVAPPPETILRAGDRLVVLGDDAGLFG